MIEQIQTILRKEGISASQLAEKLGIQRSSISHILSERNKPSLDFIQKIIDNFPHISSEWLLSGKGNYSKQIEVKKIETQTKPITQNPLPETTSVSDNKTLFDIKPTTSQETKSSDIASSINLFSEIKRGTKKKAIKVITFYDDHTFDEYFPS
jgi:transcriptional regulator with XRE-family HTH domain